jgi:hypothetical protein
VTESIPCKGIGGLSFARLPNVGWCNGSSGYGPRAGWANSNSPLAVLVMVHLLLCTSVWCRRQSKMRLLRTR